MRCGELSSKSISRARSIHCGWFSRQREGRGLAQTLVGLGCVLGSLLGCGSAETALRTGSAPASDLMILSVIGTNDTHGQLERTAVLSGYMQVIREARQADGGGVVLLSGGDMWQGTLESNLAEGASMVQAYNQVGYTAAAVGNHEFDYGPVGDRATPASPEDDPRGALLARAAEANFPLLSANFRDQRTGEPVRWPGIEAYTVVEVAGLRVGIIGASTEDTLTTTIAANVRDLRMASVVEVVSEHARELRAEGVDIVLLAVHAGGHCTEFDNPDDLSSCDPDEEVMGIARGLPSGLVDAIVGGHTHKAIAHRVAGVAVQESYAHGRAFGRVDLVIDRRTHEVVETRIFPPHDMCQGPRVAASECEPGEYEGVQVRVDQEVLSSVQPFLEAARERREEQLGVEVTVSVETSYESEAALGNWLADLMLAVREGDVAMINAGGVRASLPAGPLTYGSLYRTFPFDNRFATVTLSAEELSAALERNIQSDTGMFLISGLRAQARCEGGELRVDLQRPDGEPVEPATRLRLVLSDFLATVGDPAFVAAEARGDIQFEEDPPIREALAEHLRERGGSVSGDAPTLFDPSNPRVSFAGTRPVDCAP